MAPLLGFGGQHSTDTPMMRERNNFGQVIKNYPLQRTCLRRGLGDERKGLGRNIRKPDPF
jgi:hypothetical protein